MQNLVHQIVFNDSGRVSISGYAKDAAESVRSALDFCEYKIWGLNEADKFIRERFDSSIYAAFKCLKPYAYKADLFKYCLLYHLGGWYVDIGVRILQPEAFKKITVSKFVLFRATGFWDAPWISSVALVYAEPGSKVFLTALDEIVENCRKQNYGENPLCPTMSSFGRALAKHNVISGVRVGMIVDVKGQEYKRAYRLKPLGLIAARKPSLAKVGSLQGLGIKGSNNYSEMWKNRDVYNCQEASLISKPWVRRFTKYMRM